MIFISSDLICQSSYTLDIHDLSLLKKTELISMVGILRLHMSSVSTVEMYNEIPYPFLRRHAQKSHLILDPPFDFQFARPASIPTNGSTYQILGESHNDPKSETKSSNEHRHV